MKMPRWWQWLRGQAVRPEDCPDDDQHKQELQRREERAQRMLQSLEQMSDTVYNPKD